MITRKRFRVRKVRSPFIHAWTVLDRWTGACATVSSWSAAMSWIDFRLKAEAIEFRSRWGQ